LSVDWREEPIGRQHDRKRFDCGAPDLNEYLSRYARQNHESGGAKTFVAVSPAEPARVLGFHSIGPGSIELARVPANLTQKLGRYDVPVFGLGRLAVEQSMQGQGRAAICCWLGAPRTACRALNCSGSPPKFLSRIG